MLKISMHDHVTRFDLARSIAGRGRYWTTSYLIDGLLMDSGCAHCAHELLQALDGCKTLSCIINTHSHEDHIGANGPLQSRNAGLEVLAHPLAIPVLGSPRERQRLQAYRRFFWGYPESSIARAVRNSEQIETDDFSFRVIYTPGHSSDHLCLYEPSQEWLFSGDLFAGGRDRALRADYDIWQIIASLKLIADLPIKWLFPGCARARENPKGDLKSKIAYLEELGESVMDLYWKGWASNSIVRELCGEPMLIEFLTCGHFSRRHLVHSYIRNSPCEAS